MFRSAVLKLTLAYLTMVMAISAVFSFGLYHFATRELGLGLRNQYLRWMDEYRPFGLGLPGSPVREIDTRSHHILVELLYLNLLLLVVSGIASYWLARRTLRPIEAAHEQQKRFVADVSHELRTPLTALKMETEVALLDSRAKPADLRNTLTSSLEEVIRLEELVNNLLQLSSLEASEIRANFVSQPVRPILEDAIGVISKYAEAKQVSLQTSSVDGTVVGDRASLTRLFVILLDNAVKYSPPRSTVNIAVTGGDRRLSVAITDHGIGIDKQTLNHVFDRFYRGDKARSKQDASGFGLGLSLAKLIADLHRGEIVIRSAAGKGTIVTVSLPAKA